MANQITDNRTQLSAMDAETNITDEAGAALVSGDVNTETFIEGSGSISQKYSASVGGVLYNAGSAQDWSGNTFYIWWNVTTAGKLDSKTNGGVRMRFCGATVTDFFEIYIEGSDTYSGGFKMAVIDIERAYTAAVTDGDAFTGTGGTAPATTAIQYVGMYFDMLGMVSGNVDNAYVDAMWRLPAATPGIIVEGRNAGTTDWTFSDIFDAGDPGDTTKAWGTGFVETNGSFTFNTPIQLGINDTSTHAFSDTNAIVGWQSQFVDLADFYNITLLGNSGGTTNFELGVVSGSGDDRVGTQGGTIFAQDTEARWSLIADDANIDSCNLYGVQMIHGEDFQLDSAKCLAIGSTFLDCTSATVSNGKILKCNIINANTADDVAFMTTDDMTDIVRCAFVFSDGHAIELTTPRVASQTSKGNTFGGYGTTTSTDAAVYNNTAGAVTINITDGGTTPTYKDGTSASTVAEQTVTVTVNVKDAADSTNIQNARVFVEADTGGDLPSDVTVTIARVTTTATVTHTAHGLATGDDVAIRNADQEEYNGIKSITVTTANAYTYTVSGSPTTPATGTIKATAVIMTGLSTAGGIVTDTGFKYTTDQPVVGKVRRGSTTPYYKTSPVSGTITSSGFETTTFLVGDE